MKKTDAHKESAISKAENALGVSQGLLRDVANIIIYGTSTAEIDNFKSLLDFSSTAIRLTTTDGIIRIDGTELTLALIAEESVTVKGCIKNLSFE